MLGVAGTAMQNAPHSASKQQRQLVRVLQKDHEDKAPNHAQPAGMHNAVVGSAAMKKGAEPKSETVQRSGEKKRNVSPEPTQQVPQHTVSVSHPQSQGGARAGYLELAGLREKQQAAVPPNVGVQVSGQCCMYVHTYVHSCVCVCVHACRCASDNTATLHQRVVSTSVTVPQ